MSTFSNLHWWLIFQVREHHHGAVLRSHAQRRVRRLLRYRDQLQTQQHRIRNSQRQHLRSLQHGLQALHHRWLLPWQFPGKKDLLKRLFAMVITSNGYPRQPLMSQLRFSPGNYIYKINLVQQFYMLNFVAHYFVLLQSAIVSYYRLLGSTVTKHT